MEQEGSAFCKQDVAVVVGYLQGINTATFYRAHPSSHPLLDHQEVFYLGRTALHLLVFGLQEN
jgi:hypothetical protein